MRKLNSPSVLVPASNSLMPVFRLGTFGSDHVRATDIAQAVKTAVHMGYRHIDCVEAYQKEKEIDQGFQELFKEGVVTDKHEMAVIYLKGACALPLYRQQEEPGCKLRSCVH